MKTVTTVQLASSPHAQPATPIGRSHRPVAFARLVLTTGALLSAWSSAAEPRSVVIYPAVQGRAEPTNGFVEIGYSRDTVLFVLGDPSSKLNENLWVYRGFRTDLREARHFDTLVLQFERGKLVMFKFLDEKTLKASVAYFNHQRPVGSGSDPLAQ